jgi:hypothetical protein
MRDWLMSLGYGTIPPLGVAQLAYFARAWRELRHVSPGWNLRYIFRTAAHTLHAQPLMKTAGLGRRPARAIG